MKLFFQFCGPAALRKPWETEAMLDSFRQSLRAADHPRYRVAESERAADVIALVESVAPKDWRYLAALAAEPVIRRRPESCFTINYDDDAAGFLPGLYAGLSAGRFHPKKHRATGYLLKRTDRVDEHAAKRDRVPPRLLFSFRGANSHPVRARLFDLDALRTPHTKILRIDRWFDHTAQEEIDYFDEILESHFILCPRGIAATSHRIFEVMQLGRVPVILSDDWIAPAGPAWQKFSIRIAEAKLDALPEVLRLRLPEAHEMGRLARLEWERWFAPDTKMLTAATAIEDLALTRPPSFTALSALKEWHSFRKRWEMGWSLPHRLQRRVLRFLPL
ncbi:MAG: exostosin family protein [Opitutaceae bacterium]|nr:exostosin family protein [Opitutaceae bacterium]